uniref:Uncharacterized protein n=1 Tax=Astatotilapia calliptera TaxID=8154 RepID=A0AAX7URN4_ASTCA
SVRGCRGWTLLMAVCFMYLCSHEALAPQRHPLSRFMTRWRLISSKGILTSVMKHSTEGSEERRWTSCSSAIAVKHDWRRYSLPAPCHASRESQPHPLCLKMSAYLPV